MENKSKVSPEDALQQMLSELSDSEIAGLLSGIIIGSRNPDARKEVIITPLEALAALVGLFAVDISPAKSLRTMRANVALLREKTLKDKYGTILKEVGLA